MTDAFSKIAVVVPIPDKEASTVAQMILDCRIYRFAQAAQIHSEGGKEFVNKLLAELFAILNMAKWIIPLISGFIYFTIAMILLGVGKAYYACYQAQRSPALSTRSEWKIVDNLTG